VWRIAVRASASAIGRASAPGGRTQLAEAAYATVDGDGLTRRFGRAAASVCITGSNRDHRLLPAFLAAYIAPSALRSSSAARSEPRRATVSEPHTALQSLGEALPEQRRIGEPGESIVGRPPSQLGLEGEAFADVAEIQDDAADRDVLEQIGRHGFPSAYRDPINASGARLRAECHFVGAAGAGPHAPAPSAALARCATAPTGDGRRYPSSR